MHRIFFWPNQRYTFILYLSMLYVIIFLGLLFGGIGLILTESNAKSLLAGYNTMNEEDRRGFDIKGYVPLFRRFHLFLGLSFLAGGCGLYYLVDLDAAGVFLGVYPIVAYIYFLWASRRFFRGRSGGAGGSKVAGSTARGSSTIKYSKIGIWVLIGSLVFVLGLMVAGYKEDRLTVVAAAGNQAATVNQTASEGQSVSLRIGGMYGETIPLSNIESIVLLDTLPRITFRENGFALGRISKGYFRTADKERVKLILNTKTPPYILITKTNSRKIYYSARSASTLEQFRQKTETLNLIQE